MDCATALPRTCHASARSSTRRGLHGCSAGASLVVWIGILFGRLASGNEQAWEFDLRLLGFLFDALDEENPFIAVVEEEPHLGPDRREDFGDTRSLNATRLAVAFSHVG